MPALIASSVSVWKPHRMVAKHMNAVTKVNIKKEKIFSWQCYIYYGPVGPRLCLLKAYLFFQGQFSPLLLSAQ